MHSHERDSLKSRTNHHAVMHTLGKRNTGNLTYPRRYRKECACIVRAVRM